MKREVRICDLSILDKLLTTDVDIIGIGNENCVHKIPDINEIKRVYQVVRDAGKKLRVIFPKVPARYFSKMLEVFKQVAQLDVLITLNDYGMIYSAKSVCPLNGFSVGRSIAFSLLSSPWFSMLVDNESSEGKNSMATSNMSSELKLQYIGSFGGNELEIEYIPEVCSELELIKKMNYQISAHRDACLVSVGRACSYKRQLAREGKNCSSGCDELLSLQLEKKFVSIPTRVKEKGYNGVSHYVADEEVNRIFPDLYICGNGLYRLNNEKDFVAENVDTLIYDLRFTKLEDI